MAEGLKPARFYDQVGESVLKVNAEILDNLCRSLGEKPVDQVISELLKDGLIRPELVAILGKSLVEMLQSIRDKMKVALEAEVKNDNDLLVILMDRARKDFTTWLEANQATLMQVEALSEDIVGNLELLASITTSIDLAGISPGDCARALKTSSKLEEGMARIFQELGRRIAFHISDTYEYGSTPVDKLKLNKHFNSVSVNLPVERNKMSGDQNGEILLRLAREYFSNLSLSAETEVHYHVVEGLTISFKLGREGR